MGVYSSIDVYPKWIDDVDTSECENCDIPSLSFMEDEVYHFETGFHCTWNGFTEANVEDLPKNGCRCTGGE